MISQPTQSFLLVTLILLLVGALGIIYYVSLVAIQRSLVKSGKHPEIVRFVHQAIVLAYKSSDAVFDTIDERLHGVQKLEIATAIYCILPDTINIGWIGVKLSWKNYVSQERFTAFVSAEYDRLVEQFGVVKENILQQMLEDMEAVKAKALRA